MLWEFHGDNSKTGFPTRKILTISAQEYAGSVGNIKNNYDVVGVHGTSLQDLANNVPRNDAEVVTDLRFSTSVSNAVHTSSGVVEKVVNDFYSGTALIPKTEKKEKLRGEV